MQIDYVEINNILSIESARVDVRSQGLTLIDGWNFDDDRANGAGKSSISNAIAFALYDKVPRKITKSEILRWGAKSGFAEVVLRRGGRTFRVRRFRPVAVEYYIDDEKKNITQEEFEKMIGLNYDQFITSQYTAQEQGQPFLYKNDTEKKDFLLDLMDLSVFNACYKETSNRIKSLKGKIDEEKLKLQGYVSKIQAHSESLVDVSQIESSIQLLQEEIQGFNQELIQLREVQRPDLSQYDIVEGKINEKRKIFNQKRTEIALLRQEYQQHKRKDVPFVSRGHDDNCPSCKTPLLVTGTRVSVAGDESAAESLHENQRALSRAEAERCAAEINGRENELLRERELDGLQQQIRTKRMEAQRDYDNAQRRSSELERSIALKNQQIQTSQKAVERNDALKAKIAELRDLAKNSKDSLQGFDGEIELLEQASQIFSPTGAPAYVMDSVVDSFNQAVSGYVQLIWPSAKYELQSFKEKKDGAKVAKFSEVLTIGQREVSIGALSGGQQRALSLALDFAIRDVIDAHFGIFMNPIILDEPFNGLDTTGREIVIDLLETLSAKRNIWIVDHASEAKAMFTDIIRVEKRSEVTTVKA